MKKPNPTPAERPDLYDYCDGIERPEGYETGVNIPDYIQKLIDDRQANTPRPAEPKGQ